MPLPIRTTQEAREYLAQALGSTQTYQMYQFELGWICTRNPTEQEKAGPRQVGRSRLVLDARTGVITQFPSLGVQTTAEWYTKAIQEGTRMLGGRIYPPTIRVRAQQISDEPTRVTYLVESEALENPDQRIDDYHLAIDKQNDSLTPQNSATSQLGNRLKNRYHRDGTWPAQATFEY